MALASQPVEARATTAAKGPSGTCPELYGNPPMYCSDPSCGGKDGSQEICKNRNSGGQQCQCKDAPTTGAPPAPKTTVVTGTTSGKTIVGTYELQTLTKYTSLKQEATITTTSSGSNGVETAVAVIAAGGVAWFLGYVGEAGAATVLTPETPATPEGHDDDPSCPAQHDKCGDCGGTLGFCVTKNPGCACDEDEDQQCPTGDQEPKCSDNSCKGQNGKCTTGDHKNCDCSKTCPTGDQTPKCSDDTCKGQDEKCTTGDNNGCACDPGPECPDERYKPFCDFCGDKGDDGKCKGISDKSGLWKGCDCMDEPDDKDIETWPPASQAALNFDPDALPDESIDTYSYSGNDPLNCQNLGWGAQRDQLEKSIGDWCKTNNGKTVNKKPGVDTIYNRFGYSYYSYWLAATFDDSNGNCGTSSKVDERNCHSTMQEMLDYCNVGQNTFNGATLIDDCTRYTLTFSTSTVDEDPPWNPLPQAQKTPSCPDPNVISSEVTYNFWQGVSKTFCDHVNKDPGKALKETLTNNDFQSGTTKSKRSDILRRTPPPSAGSYPDYTFDFDWEGNPSGAHCVKDCSQTMEAFTEGCGHVGNQQNTMQETASYDSGCGKYTYTVNGPPPKYEFQPICGKEQLYPFFDQFALQNIPTPDSKLIAPMCAYFGSDDMSKKNDDPRHFAYGHSGDNGVYLNYGTFDNGKACDAAGGANKPFSQGDCQYALSKMFPACDGQAGGSIPYKCVLYEYKFRKWDSVQDANVKF